MKCFICSKDLAGTQYVYGGHFHYENGSLGPVRVCFECGRFFNLSDKTIDKVIFDRYTGNCRHGFCFGDSPEIYENG